MRQSVFYPAIFGYVLGIFGRSFFLWSFSFEICAAFWLAVTLIFLAAVNKMYDVASIRRYSLIFLVIVGALFVALGAIRYSFFDMYLGDSILASYAGKKIQAEGVITAEPDVREKSVRLTVALDTLVKDGSRILLKPTKVIMSADTGFKISYGDRISVSGTITRPDNFVGDNGRIFDYVSYLAKDRILYVVDYPKVVFISSGDGNRLESSVLFLKDEFLDGLDTVVPAPESSLGAGLVIAGKRALPSSIQNEFERSGTVQVIVLSGYNVTVVAETLANMFAFLPAAVGAVLGVFGILVFTIAAGATATVVRASIMALIVILSKLMRRRYSVVRALILSAFLMLVANPLLLVFDPSFQLSFIATLGLIIVSPMIDRYFLFLPETFMVRGTVVATIATQIFVLPFILYLTGMFSLVAVPANLLIFLFIPISMFLCFIAGILGALNTFFSVMSGRSLDLIVWVISLFTKPLAVIAAIPATAVLHYELFVVHVFASFPFAAFTVSVFPAWVMFVVYAGYVAVIGEYYRRMKLERSNPTDDVTAAIIKGFHPSTPSDPSDPMRSPHTR